MSTNRKILLVEDESIIALNQKHKLEKYAYEVRILSSGEKAIEYMRKPNDIDLILMDINLGKGINGTRTAQKILDTSNIPIIFLSSHCEQDQQFSVSFFSRKKKQKKHLLSINRISLQLFSSYGRGAFSAKEAFTILIAT